MGDGSLLLFARNDEHAEGPSLLSLHPDGTNLWRTFLGTPGDSSPALVGGSSIVFGTYSGDLRSFGVGADMRFNTALTGPVFSSPALRGGVGYVGSGNGLVAFDSTSGAILWTALPGVLVSSSPAIMSDGTILVLGEDDIVHAISPAGDERWRVRIGNESGAQSWYPSPTIRDDGVILVGGKVPRLTAISPDGHVLWTAPARAPFVWSTPAVALDGTAFWSDSDPSGTVLHATDHDGSPKWSVSVGAPQTSGDALVDADGVVYFSALNGDTVAIDPSDGSVLWRIDGKSRDGGGIIALGIGRRAYVFGSRLSDTFRVIEDASCAK